MDLRQQIDKLLHETERRQHVKHTQLKDLQVLQTERQKRRKIPEEFQRPAQPFKKRHRHKNQTARVKPNNRYSNSNVYTHQQMAQIRRQLEYSQGQTTRRETTIDTQSSKFFDPKNCQIEWQNYFGGSVNNWISENDVQSLEGLISNAVYSRITPEDFFIFEHKNFHKLCRLSQMLVEYGFKHQSKLKKYEETSKKDLDLKNDEVLLKRKSAYINRDKIMQIRNQNTEKQKRLQELEEEIREKIGLKGHIKQKHQSMFKQEKDKEWLLKKKRLEDKKMFQRQLKFLQERVDKLAKKASSPKKQPQFIEYNFQIREDIYVQQDQSMDVIYLKEEVQSEQPKQIANLETKQEDKAPQLQKQQDELLEALGLQQTDNLPLNYDDQFDEEALRQSIASFDQTTQDNLLGQGKFSQITEPQEADKARELIKSNVHDSIQLTKVIKVNQIFQKEQSAFLETESVQSQEMETESQQSMNQTYQSQEMSHRMIDSYVKQFQSPEKLESIITQSYMKKQGIEEVESSQMDATLNETEIQHQEIKEENQLQLNIVMFESGVLDDPQEESKEENNIQKEITPIKDPQKGEKLHRRKSSADIKMEQETQQIYISSAEMQAQKITLNMASAFLHLSQEKVLLEKPKEDQNAHEEKMIEEPQIEEKKPIEESKEILEEEEPKQTIFNGNNEEIQPFEEYLETFKKPPKSVAMKERDSNSRYSVGGYKIGERNEEQILYDSFLNLSMEKEKEKDSSANLNKDDTQNILQKGIEPVERVRLSFDPMKDFPVVQENLMKEKTQQPNQIEISGVFDNNFQFPEQEENNLLIIPKDEISPIQSPEKTKQEKETFKKLAKIQLFSDKKDKVADPQNVELQEEKQEGAQNVKGKTQFVYIKKNKDKKVKVNKYKKEETVEATKFIYVSKDMIQEEEETSFSSLEEESDIYLEEKLHLYSQNQNTSKLNTKEAQL